MIKTQISTSLQTVYSVLILGFFIPFHTYLLYIGAVEIFVLDDPCKAVAPTYLFTIGLGSLLLGLTLFIIALLKTCSNGSKPSGKTISKTLMLFGFWIFVIFGWGAATVVMSGKFYFSVIKALSECYFLQSLLFFLFSPYNSVKIMGIHL